ncbi:hypothetical protein SK128_011423 [Halocaridina rubra]|uniref:Uncharacterized protein n=1 Tax=Halocaridina rubra TaxID=373956 RepID=A0AAN8ZX64_HALRR
MDSLGCYRELWEEKKTASFLTRLDQDFVKVEPPSTDSVPSTTAASIDSPTPVSPASVTGSFASPDSSASPASSSLYTCLSLSCNDLSSVQDNHTSLSCLCGDAAFLFLSLFSSA